MRPVGQASGFFYQSVITSRPIDLTFHERAEPDLWCQTSEKLGDEFSNLVDYQLLKAQCTAQFSDDDTGV